MSPLGDEFGNVVRRTVILIQMQRPGVSTMLGRAVRRRCPWCGGRGAFFTGWFAKSDRCHTCGIAWRRGDVGFELGAASISAIIVLGTLVAGMGGTMVATWPDVPYVWLFVGLALAAVALPVLVYPITFTIWQAVDLMMRPPEPGEDAPEPVR
ncbi:hypothetical protein BH18ACT3_BH18ACT3_15550 [soil metagenome]